MGEDTITLNCRIIEERDFWITVRLKDSGMILDLMKKDLVTPQKESNDG